MSCLCCAFVFSRSFLTLLTPPSTGEGDRALPLASSHRFSRNIDSGHVSSKFHFQLQRTVYSQRKLTPPRFCPPAVQNRRWCWRGTSRATPASGGAKRRCKVARGSPPLLPSRLTPQPGNNFIAFLKAGKRLQSQQQILNFSPLWGFLFLALQTELSPP